MEPKIKIYGTASLQEIYNDENDLRYYIILSASVKAEGKIKFFPAELKIEVPIIQESYDSLRKALSESTAEKPVLRVSGDLELILGSGCIN